ncbi:hypothetical protein K501DRAFT_141971, partial [Backusella circina FSU 941]
FIPIDIADTISHNLTQKQIGSCRSVCKTWEYIFTSPLYRHVQIRGRNQFNLFYQSLFSVTRPGVHLRQLLLDDVSLTDDELDQLGVQCPYLVEFIYQGKSISDHPSTAAGGYWQHLRRLSEQHDLSLACRLLDSPSCNLTQLSVCFSEQKWNKSELLPLLMNAKQLESLSLDTLQLSYIELEQIHQVSPNLNKLQLLNTRLGEITDSDANEITPSVKTASFEFHNGVGLDNVNWLRYFRLKYPNLRHLSLWNSDSPSIAPTSSIELQEYYRAIADFVMSCTQLKSAEFFNVLMNEWVIQGMEEAGIELDSLALSDMTDYTLHLLEVVCASTLNIRSLTLWGWPSLCIPEMMKEALSRIGHCSNRLTHLCFSMAHSGIINAPLPIDVLLDKCGSLDSICLENTQLILTAPMEMMREAVGRHPNGFPRPKLRSLKIQNGAFRGEVFDYLAYRCQEIRHLEIDSSAHIYQKSETLYINMPHNEFDTFCINSVNTPHSHH